MEKYCNPCAPIAKAEVTTHTDKGEAKEPINVSINGDYIIGGVLVWVLYKLLNAMRRVKPAPKQLPEAGISQFIQRMNSNQSSGKFCTPPNVNSEFKSSRTIEGTPWIR